jgi:hypothetical protein
LRVSTIGEFLSFFFLVVLGFEFRALSKLSRHTLLLESCLQPKLFFFLLNRLISPNVGFSECAGGTLPNMM